MREINELLYIFEKYEGMLKAPAIIMDMSSTFLNDISKNFNLNQYKTKEKIMKKFSIALVSMLFPALILAQNSVSGTVTDATSGQALAGANVVLEGTSLGGSRC